MDIEVETFANYQTNYSNRIEQKFKIMQKYDVSLAMHSRMVYPHTYP